MPLILSKMEDKDFPRAFEIISLAFGDRAPFMNQFYPQHDTAQGRATGAKRLWEVSKDDPNTTCLKVVDTDLHSSDPAHLDGLMVGMAKWNFYSDGKIPPKPEKFAVGPWWDDGKGDQAYAETLAQAFFARRGKAVADSRGRVFNLDYIAVDPKHQRRGVASLFMEWGMKKADEMDLGGTIEATDQGAPLYRNFGYKDIEPFSLEMPEPWANLPRENATWMIRPRKSDGNVWEGASANPEEALRWSREAANA